MSQVETMYTAYLEQVRKVIPGYPFPEWSDLDPEIQNAWVVGFKALSGSLVTSMRELQQIAHAKDYADHFEDAGVPGHGQFMLIAKLARLVGL